MGPVISQLLNTEILKRRPGLGNGQSKGPQGKQKEGKRAKRMVTRVLKVLGQCSVLDVAETIRFKVAVTDKWDEGY